MNKSAIVMFTRSGIPIYVERGKVVTDDLSIRLLCSAVHCYPNDVKRGALFIPRVTSDHLLSIDAVSVLFFKQKNEMGIMPFELMPLCPAVISSTSNVLAHKLPRADAICMMTGKQPVKVYESLDITCDMAEKAEIADSILGALGGEHKWKIVWDLVKTNCPDTHQKMTNWAARIEQSLSLN